MDTFVDSVKTVFHNVKTCVGPPETPKDVLVIGRKDAILALASFRADLLAGGSDILFPKGNDPNQAVTFFTDTGLPLSLKGRGTANAFEVSIE